MIYSWDLFDDKNKGPKEWVELWDCGGFARVNNITFELFIAMETKLIEAPNFNAKLVADDDVQVFWCMISSDWVYIYPSGNGS